MPKPLTKKAKAEARCQQLNQEFHALMTRTGAAHTPDAIYPYILQTRYGPLRLGTDNYPSKVRTTIYARFDDSDCAKPLLGPGLYTGKWNHHYPIDQDPAEIIADFEATLKFYRLIPIP